MHQLVALAARLTLLGLAIAAAVVADERNGGFQPPSMNAYQISKHAQQVNSNLNIKRQASDNYYPPPHAGFQHTQDQQSQLKHHVLNGPHLQRQQQHQLNQHQQLEQHHHTHYQNQQSQHLYQDTHHNEHHLEPAHYKLDSAATDQSFMFQPPPVSKEQLDSLIYSPLLADQQLIVSAPINKPAAPRYQHMNGDAPHVTASADIDLSDVTGRGGDNSPFSARGRLLAAQQMANFEELATRAAVAKLVAAATAASAKQQQAPTRDPRLLAPTQSAVVSQSSAPPPSVALSDLTAASKTSGDDGQQRTGDDQTNGVTTTADASNGSDVSATTVSQNQNFSHEKSVEPRVRRRMFNRILKKTEWNHLFVELSKVLVRYFLDLALKDIIGKQSGERASGSGGTETTSGRKKLDAQSEITDLLKDFVKTAISNM